MKLEMHFRAKMIEEKSAEALGKQQNEVKKRAPPYQVWNKCAGCAKRIRSRFLLSALGRTWHESCLKCDCCQEVLYSFREPCIFYRDGYKLCRHDYLMLHGNTGICSMCDETILPTEQVMRFKDKYIYHQRCFQCVHCKSEFKKGDFAGIPDAKQILCYEHYAKFITTNTNLRESNISHQNSDKYNFHDTYVTKNVDCNLQLHPRLNNTLQCSTYQELSCQQIPIQPNCIIRTESGLVTRQGDGNFHESFF